MSQQKMTEMFQRKQASMRVYSVRSLAVYVYCVQSTVVIIFLHLQIHWN